MNTAAVHRPQVFVEILMNEEIAKAHYANLFLNTTTPDGQVGEDALRGIQERGPVAAIYFSPQNIEIMGRAIQGMVYNQTGESVGTQSQLQLLWVMRSIYLQHSENRPGDVKTQVRELNTRVLEYAVPNVISNMFLHKRFLSEVGRNPVPLSRGAATSRAGSRQLELRL